MAVPGEGPACALAPGQQMGPGADREAHRVEAAALVPGRVAWGRGAQVVWAGLLPQVVLVASEQAQAARASQPGVVEVVERALGLLAAATLRALLLPWELVQPLVQALVQALV